jgi:hypothetical protein
MNRTLLAGGLLAVGLVAPLPGETTECLKGCANGALPNCCKPLPCEFHSELQYVVIMERMNRDEQARQALRLSGGDHAKARRLLSEAAREEAEARSGGCKSKTPHLELSEKCEIVQAGQPPGQSRPAGREALKKDGTGCSELIDLQFDVLELYIDSCLEARGPIHVETAASLERTRLERYWSKLTEQKKHYLWTCKIFLGLKKVKEVNPPVEDELAPLDTKVKTLKNKSAAKPKKSLPTKSRGGKKAR